MVRTERILSLVSLIFGAVAALGSALILFFSRSLGSSAAGLTQGEPPLRLMKRLAQVEAEISPYKSLLWGSTLLLGVALLVVGIGLYRQSAWARPAASRWSLAALLFIPLQLWLQLGVIEPRLHAMASALAEMHGDLTLSGPPTGADWAFKIIRHLLIYAPLPVMLLILMRRSHGKSEEQDQQQLA